MTKQNISETTWFILWKCISAKFKPMFLVYYLIHISTQQPIFHNHGLKLFRSFESEIPVIKVQSELPRTDAMKVLHAVYIHETHLNCHVDSYSTMCFSSLCISGSSSCDQSLFGTLTPSCHSKTCLPTPVHPLPRIPPQFITWPS